jgi:hypothetical protein
MCGLRRYGPFVIVVLMLLIASNCRAQEKKISRSDLPAAVERTVQAESRGATIRGFSEEKEDGKTYYEVEMSVNGHSKDVTIDSEGAVSEVEEEITLHSIPRAVQKGLKAKAGVGRIAKVESITKHDTLVAYEAHVVTAGKKSEVQVGPDGKLLDHEE